MLFGFLWGWTCYRYVSNETFLTAKECLPRWRRRLFDRPPLIKARHPDTFLFKRQPKHMIRLAICMFQKTQEF